jgi:hypothetical protein
MTERGKSMNPEIARAYFKDVGSLARTEPNRAARRDFFRELKADPEYQQARQALTPNLGTTFENKEPTTEESMGKTEVVSFRPAGGQRELFTMVAARTGKDLSKYMRYAGLIVANKVFEEAGGYEAVKAWYDDVRARGRALEQRNTSQSNKPNGTK